MIRHAMRCLNCQRENSLFIGDQMETDIFAGIYSEVDTAMVLSGATRKEHLAQYACRPTYILQDVGDILGK